jgi:hypothetical protein
MGDQLFVPADFAVPGGLTAGEMRLEPLGPRHNAADYAAWTASTGHIQATPGFPWGGWPHEMSLAENLYSNAELAALRSLCSSAGSQDRSVMLRNTWRSRAD